MRVRSALLLLLFSCSGNEPAPAAPDAGADVADDTADSISDTQSQEVGDTDGTPDVPGDDTADTADTTPEALPGLTTGGTDWVLAGGRLELRREGAVRLAFPPDAFELGVVPALSDELNYDPTYFEPGVEL